MKATIEKQEEQRKASELNAMAKTSPASLFTRSSFHRTARIRPTAKLPRRPPRTNTATITGRCSETAGERSGVMTQLPGHRVMAMRPRVSEHAPAPATATMM